jgi:hypothetical protein
MALMHIYEMEDNVVVVNFHHNGNRLCGSVVCVLKINAIQSS